MKCPKTLCDCYRACIDAQHCRKKQDEEEEAQRSSYTPPSIDVSFGSFSSDSSFGSCTPDSGTDFTGGGGMSGGGGADGSW